MAKEKVPTEEENKEVPENEEESSGPFKRYKK